MEFLLIIPFALVVIGAADDSKKRGAKFMAVAFMIVMFLCSLAFFIYT